MISIQLSEPQTERNEGTPLLPVLLLRPSEASLIERTEKDTHAGVYTDAPKSVREGTSTLGTPRLRIYTSVGVTSALSLIRV